MMMRRRDSKLGGRTSFLGALLTFLLWFLALSGLEIILPVAALVATIAAAFGLMGGRPGASRTAQVAGWTSTLAFVVVMFVYVVRIYGAPATLIGTIVVLGVALVGGVALIIASSLRSKKRAQDEETSKSDVSEDEAAELTAGKSDGEAAGDTSTRHERLVAGASALVDDIDPEFAAEVEANETALEAHIAASEGDATETAIADIDGSATNEPWVED